jgi:cytochrome P450
MFIILRYIGLGLLFSVAIIYCKYRLRATRNEAKATALGCKPIPSISHELFFGLDTTWRRFKATKENRLLPYFQSICTEIGALTYKYQWLDKSVIFTAEPANLRALVATNFKDFELPFERNEALRPLFGEAIFIQNGEAWRHSRSLLRPYFSREHLSTLEAAEQQIKPLLQKLPCSADGWTEVTDLYPLFADFTMNNTSDFLFGRPIISSSPSGNPNNEVEIERAESFIDATDFMSDYAGLRLYAGNAYWIFNSALFRRQCETIYNYIDNQISISLSSKSTISDKFTLANSLAQDVQDPQALRPFILTMLFAARDTTGKISVLQLYKFI